MASHSGKQPACANCAYAFVPGEPDEFCPRCGQQNHSATVGFGHVLEEFMEGVFHFDGKVFRTLRLLLLRPGELTRQFLGGHRVPFVPPIRLYVFISFVFFFLLTLSSHHDEKKAGEATKGLQVRVGPQEVPAAGSQPHTIQLGYSPDMRQFTKAQLDSLPENLTRAQADSVLRRHHMEPGVQARLVVQHLPRLMRLSPEALTHQVLKSLSIMLFVLMPLAALLLLLAYRRQQPRYVGHLIAAIHLHCFVFVVLLVLLGIDYLPLPDGTGLVVALLIPLYLVLALRRLYGQGWVLTLLKGALLAAGYTALLTVSCVAALVLGLSLV